MGRSSGKHPGYHRQRNSTLSSARDLPFRRLHQHHLNFIFPKPKKGLVPPKVESKREATANGVGAVPPLVRPPIVLVDIADVTNFGTYCR